MLPLPFYLHHEARLVVSMLDHVAPVAGGGPVQGSYSGMFNTDGLYMAVAPSILVLLSWRHILGNPVAPSCHDELAEAK